MAYVEDELIEKGYSYYGNFRMQSMAKAKAEALRKEGYYARVVVYTTGVRGYHDFAVWYKKKEKK